MNEFLEIVEMLEHAETNRLLNKATVKKMKIAWFILKDIQNSLPHNRDWLNPDTERMMNELLSE